MEKPEFPSFASPSSQSSLSLRRRPLQHPTFLVTDEYPKMHTARAHLLKTRLHDVIAVLPDQPAVDSCEEVLELVARELADAYAAVITVEGDSVRNALTGESFQWRGTTGRRALEIAARLAMEDLNVLMPLNGLHHRL
jgi:hypothetical protein